MRPVTKPLPPLQSPVYGSGPSRGWSKSRILQGALVDTIGGYCSFCELPINVDDNLLDKRSALKGGVARLEAWDFLLLACDYCKTNRRPNQGGVDTYLWPDVDATFTLQDTSPFLYRYQQVDYILKDRDGGTTDSGTTSLVIVEANPQSSLRDKAQRTLDLFQLNTPAYDARTNTLTCVGETLGTYPDRRLFLRTEAWQVALQVISRINDARKVTLTPIPYEMAWEMVPAVARSLGFWSVWMTAFWEAYQDAARLTAAFIETKRRKDLVVYGYQALLPPKQPLRSAPLLRPRPPPAQSFLLFTGTAKDRITFPAPPAALP